MHRKQTYITISHEEISEPRPSDYQKLIAIDLDSVVKLSSHIKKCRADKGRTKETTPCITLTGQHLIRAGFGINQPYQVEIFEGEIFIRRI